MWYFDKVKFFFREREEYIGYGNFCFYSSSEFKIEKFFDGFLVVVLYRLVYWFGFFFVFGFILLR